MYPVCGDRLGCVRIFDLTNMSLVGTLKAHIAEVLTLTFSPPMIALENSSGWSICPSVNSPEEDNSTVLLASAGI